ncbi:MAG: FCD domain-containing protein [Brooklawnia sp.]|uniref:FadR/GntR family transcriptional regulator n=1 Tax=Brooklawnia sp. TaxID=2699740 RepID=UPI003C724402
MVGLSPGHQRVLSALRESGVRPGDVLPSEPELADRLGVSRQSVREALVAMQALGLVEGRQGTRRRLACYEVAHLAEQVAVSVDPNPENLLQLLQVRRALERSFLPAAAQHLGRRRLRELGELSDVMVQRAAKGHAFVDADERFHTLLYAGLGNRALDGFVRGFWQVFRQAPPPITTAANLVSSAAVHRGIVEALRGGDAELAVHRLDAHFYDVQSRIAASRLDRFGQGSRPATAGGR